MVSRARRTAVLVGMLAIALVTSVLPAQAGPPLPVVRPDPGEAPKQHHQKTSQLSAKEKSKVKFGWRMVHYAETKPKIIDYRRADKYDQGHVTSRRRFVAGFIYNGGKVTHIGAGELRKVKALLPHPRPLRAAEKPYCRGRQGIKVYSKLLPSYKMYWNSCSTARIIAVWSVDMIVLGVGATLLGATGAGAPAALVLGMLSAILALGVTIVSYYRDTSSVSSVWVRDYRVLVWMGRE